jgi:hypothetical protein
MTYTDFTEERQDEIRTSGKMTAEERAWLLEDTPRFEECDWTRVELEAMPDAELMRAAYSTWADYVRGPI